MNIHKIFFIKCLTNLTLFSIIKTQIKKGITFMKTIITLNCPLCGTVHGVEVNTNEYAAWMSGELIQNAMPSLTATEREQLISQLCPDCQRKIFGY